MSCLQYKVYSIAVYFYRCCVVQPDPLVIYFLLKLHDFIYRESICNLSFLFFFALWDYVDYEDADLNDDVVNPEVGIVDTPYDVNGTASDNMETSPLLPDRQGWCCCVLCSPVLRVFLAQ